MRRRGQGPFQLCLRGQGAGLSVRGQDAPRAGRFVLERHGALFVRERKRPWRRQVEAFLRVCAANVFRFRRLCVRAYGEGAVRQRKGPAIPERSPASRPPRVHTRLRAQGFRARSDGERLARVRHRRQADIRAMGRHVFAFADRSPQRHAAERDIYLVLFAPLASRDEQVPGC